MVAMGQSQMPPLSLWRWGFETKTHRQICTNTNVCNHFIPSSLCDHVGTDMRNFVPVARSCANVYLRRARRWKWDAGARLRGSDALMLLAGRRRVDRGMGRGGAGQ